MALDIKGCSGRVYVEFRHVWCMSVCPQWCAKENYMEGKHGGENPTGHPDLNDK